jgi:hypothetical protein
MSRLISPTSELKRRHCGIQAAINGESIVTFDCGNLGEHPSPVNIVGSICYARECTALHWQARMLLGELVVGSF